MGMFDEIIVPKSYLRNLLRKKDEKLLKTKHVFQTKVLDNVLDLYKIHRQQLYKRERPMDNGGSADEWTKVINVADICFWDTVRDENGDEHWIEFKFVFKKGKVDSKKLVDLSPGTTRKERESIDKMWDTEQKILDAYRTTSIKYKFYRWLEGRFQRITNWARKKHHIPLEIREEAYKKSGRLKRDPDCLKLYADA